MSATIAIPYASSLSDLNAPKRVLCRHRSRERKEMQKFLQTAKEEDQQQQFHQKEWSNTSSSAAYSENQVCETQTSQIQSSVSSSAPRTCLSVSSTMEDTSASLGYSATTTPLATSSAKKFGPAGPHVSPVSKYIAANTAYLPSPFRKPKRKILVLDIDECIIHSEFLSAQNGKIQNYRPTDEAIAFQSATTTSSSSTSLPSSVSTDSSMESSSSSSALSTASTSTNPYPDSFVITMSDGEKAIIHKRPGLDIFLERVAPYYDIYAYSAGLEMYGQPILDYLDPNRKFFKKAYFRTSCILSSTGMYLKDLRLFSEDLGHVILVDNNPISFLMQPQNGIPVPSFYDNENDRTLEALWKVLDYMKNMDDVRPILQRMFHLKDILAEYQKCI